jgi:hypothetical protein
LLACRCSWLRVTYGVSVGDGGLSAVVVVHLAGVLGGGMAMAAGLRAAGPARAAWFGLAAGIGDAFMAVLAKAFADSFGHGLSGAVVRWTPYVLVAAGVVVMLLISTAYQAGYPTRTLPIIAVADPLFGCLIG